MLNFKLFAVLAFILTSGIFYEEVFGDAGPEYSTPTQPNAFASYTNATNQIQVSWDFNTLPVDTKCFLKGDISYNSDLASNSGGEEDAIPSFTPRFYSPITSNPVLIEAVNNLNSNQFAEEVSCTGETRIDIDTLMNHSQNTNNYPDMQIFLTFYAPVNGDFNNENGNRIDEVFVMYTPVSIFDLYDTQTYGCDGQIGSTLYIDASGSNDSIIAHGTNGDNCDGAEFKYLYLENNEYVDVGMNGVSHGIETYGNHIQSVYDLLIQVVAQISELVTSNSGGDDDHNSRPTFGFDHKTFVQRVDHGLVINGEVYTVTDNYWTPMPMLSLHVGETQNFTSTVFAPHQLKIMEFAFGIPELGKWYDREASIEIETNYNGEIISSEVVEFYFPPVINATSLESSISKVKCVANDNAEPCYRVSVEFSFLEAPIGNVFGVQAIDQDRKNQILYFNDGLDIEGESQNPPVTQEIISEIKYKGLQTIQRIDKENDIWMTLDKSEPVVLYKQNDHGTFNPIEHRIFEKTPDVITTNMDRLHSEFPGIVLYEQTRAVQYFDSALYLGQLDPAWSHHWKETDRMDENKDAIEVEKIRTLEAYEQLYPDYEKTVQNFE